MKDLLYNNAKNIYIHIPFCIKKCNYCSFISYINIQTHEDLYINTLCKEIEAFACDKTIDTVYLGGGTPNLLRENSVEKIVSTLHNCFNFSHNIEFTMEFNPKISNFEYVKSIKELGINRISLGAQSFNDNILKTLERIHNSQDTLDFIEILNRAEIQNYSLDLMYGIFGQNIEILKNDLKIIKRLNPKHISTYGLKIEEGTPFAKFSKKTLPDEDMCAKMYLLISEELKNAGYKHYEISNFAKDGFVAKHNMAYWQNKEYYGFGVAAHGYLNTIRYKNPDSIEKYISDVTKKEILSKNSKDDILEEEIFLGLRTSDGIDLEKIKNKFNIDLYKKHEKFIQEIIQSGHGNVKDNKLSLTEKGFLISNYILGELIS